MIDEVIASTKVEPRPYQRRIVTKVNTIFNGEYVGPTGQVEEPAKSVIIESPTGSGKTVMALLACKAMQVRHPDLTIGWIAMRRNLLAQAAKENTEKGINVRDIHFVSMFDKRPEALLEASRQGKVLLVVDEAQHDAATSMSHLHNIVNPTYILGMTATPFRTDRMKLCFDKVIKDAGIHTLIQDGYLSKFNHFTIPTWNPVSVSTRYLAEPARWGKSIFYFKNLDQCGEMSKLLSAAGVRNEVVTGDTDWEDQLDLFRSGEVPCLINCMKLTEGFDEPSLQTAWVRDSGKGCTMQMGGRAFRKHPDIQLKNIVQSKLTRWPFMRTAMPEYQYLWQDESWLSLKVNPKLETINLNARIAICSIPVVMPKFILERAKKVTRLRRE
jgi:superfamily II DNA or RNA helicase